MSYVKPQLRKPMRVADCIAENIRTSRATGSGEKKMRSNKPRAMIDIGELLPIVSALCAKHGIALTQAQRNCVMCAVAREVSLAPDIITSADRDTRIADIVLWECEIMDVDVIVPKAPIAKKAPLSIIVSLDDKKPAHMLNEEERAAFIAARQARKVTDREKETPIKKVKRLDLSQARVDAWKDVKTESY